MEITVFASGSKGNATLIETNGFSFFIDIGISFTKLMTKLRQCQKDRQPIDAVFLTHEHSDHTSGLEYVFKNKLVKTLYATAGTIKALSGEVKALIPEIIVVKAGTEVLVGELKIDVVDISHDAAEPVGYVVTNSENKKLVYITDAGYVPQKEHHKLMDANLYLIESNHSAAMLMKSRRPYYLKQRIIGTKGHLSNDDAAMLIDKVAHANSVWFVMHISEECNTQLEIEKSVVKYLEKSDTIEVRFCWQDCLESIKL